MSPSAPRFGAVVLAAGAGRRFSVSPGAKLLADLDGQPLLEHVLVALRSFRPAATVVVLGHGAQDVERTIVWRGEVRVVNPTPERGLASSLLSGLRALASLRGEMDGAFIVLGDQPRLRSTVMKSLAEASSATMPSRSLIVPRYVDEVGPRNPVLLLRSVWGLAEETSGDQGLAALIDARPDLVLEVPVDGSMPDVDEPSDLARLRTKDAPS
jgi:molybdenum cofactor cytidylyltransferase